MLGAMPTDARTSRVVEPLFQLWSHVYDARLFQLYYGHIHDRILRGAPDRVDAALDVGCGTGELLAKLARRYPAARLVGVDISAAMLEQARGKAYGAARVELVEGSVYTLPFADGQFELVTNTISSHFYRDFPAAARELARVAAPGARLAMASTGNGPLRLLPGALGKQTRVGDTIHRSPAHQRALLEDAGWIVERVHMIVPAGWLYLARRAS
jgi:ubiquinone/menaquinone biosynthesis C-methylase UbiE